jgi:hypothetical protein
MPPLKYRIFVLSERVKQGQGPLFSNGFSLGQHSALKAGTPGRDKRHALSYSNIEFQLDEIYTTEDLLIFSREPTEFDEKPAEIVMLRNLSNDANIVQKLLKEREEKKEAAALKEVVKSFRNSIKEKK